MSSGAVGWTRHYYSLAQQPLLNTDRDHDPRPHPHIFKPDPMTILEYKKRGGNKGMMV